MQEGRNISFNERLRPPNRIPKKLATRPRKVKKPINAELNSVSLPLALNINSLKPITIQYNKVAIAMRRLILLLQ